MAKLSGSAHQGCNAAHHFMADDVEGVFADVSLMGIQDLLRGDRLSDRNRYRTPVEEHGSLGQYPLRILDRNRHDGSAGLLGDQRETLLRLEQRLICRPRPLRKDAEDPTLL